VTNDELNQLLRRAVPPARDANYWKEFPEAVAQRVRTESPDTIPATCRQPSVSVWIKGLALAGAVALAALILWPGFLGNDRPEPPVQALQTYYRNMSELFPHQFEAMIVSGEGVQLQLSDRADIPSSPPLYVRICGPSARCTTVVTFSGQSIRVGGKEFEILATGEGKILVLAQEGVWTPGDGPVSGQRWHFESGWLNL
jgi:hypothetical protein